MTDLNSDGSGRARVRLFLVGVIIAVAMVSIFVPTLSAQDKAPFSPWIFDISGGALHPGTSSLSDSDFKKCLNYYSNKREYCTEQFATTGGFSFGLSARTRYVQIDGFNIRLLGNFNGLDSRTSTFVCVSGCTGNAGTRIISGHSGFFS